MAFDDTKHSKPPEPVDVLSAWIALEVLSPSTFRRPQEFDTRAKVVSWPGATCLNEPIIVGGTSYHHVPLGELRLSAGFAALTKRFGADEEQRPPSGRALLASVVTDANGVPVRGSLAISSLAFGLPQAVRDGTNRLHLWQDAEHEAIRLLTPMLWPDVDEGDVEEAASDGRKQEVSPVTASRIETCGRALASHFGLEDGWWQLPTFVLGVPRDDNAEPPSPLLLNSFYLNDLIEARRRAAEGTLPPVLARYFAGENDARDVLADDSLLRELVDPAAFPTARWPSPGGFPLVLLQQAAVNAACAAESGNLLAVNGPPGTGKTTLLRDILAKTIEDRAAAMAAFDDPQDAFAPAASFLPRGRRYAVSVHAVHPTLHGHGVLVASSNNKAVENVSGELPRRDAVAHETSPHLPVTGSSVLGEEGSAWGLIAGVLGNMKNRSMFAERFWWNQDEGFRSFLEPATGRRRLITILGTDGEPAIVRPPRAVSEQVPPKGRKAAMNAWRVAREEFASARKEATAHIADMRDVAALTASADHLQRVADAAVGEADELGARSHQGAIFLRPWRALQAWRARRLAVRASQVAHNASLAVQARLDRNPGRAINDAWARTEHEDRQLTPPWLSDEAHRAREAVFSAALKIHRTFLAASASKVIGNLDAMADVLKGRDVPESVRRHERELWATLWCAAPLLSTTFASVGRLMTKLGDGDVGWLLIDEAGQATPQSAVGALTRARRAVVVGDPLQVEPVTSLPRRLTEALFAEHRIDPSVWALDASVQTLADTASPYRATYGERQVGLPLLVHRRCEEPMVTISNEVAYEGLMVPAAPYRPPGRVGAVLGESRWFDVSDDGAGGKWSEAEGALVRLLLRKLAKEGVTDPDLFIVTPFRDVQAALRQLVRTEGLCTGLSVDPKRWLEERIGTVHTVQGREAEAILFVLGAPGEDQAGAKRWAASRPNIVNVAATRARSRFYVIGCRNAWLGLGAADVMAWKLRTVPFSPKE